MTKKNFPLALFLLLSVFVFQSFAQNRNEFLGLNLRPEARAIIKEIEDKTGKKIYVDFVQQENYTIGSSFIADEDGTAVVLIDFGLEKDAKQLEAVFVHEILHLRLRVNNYPTYIFSPTVQTAKGRAIDVEQGNINDLKDLIEHRIFRAEMDKFGLHKFINIAREGIAGAKKDKGKVDGQDDSINFARAALEYVNQSEIDEMRKIYVANGWTRSLLTGQEIADIIKLSNVRTPQDAEAVFLKCLLKLYPPPNANFTFRLAIDPTNKYFRRMTINVGRRSRKRN